MCSVIDTNMEAHEMAQIKSVDKLQADDFQVKVKLPKRVLHFSDGTLEEYSDDENEEADMINNVKPVQAVDTSKLGWGPWMVHKALGTGYYALDACDYVGETLAEFLGITTPKYYIEIEEYMRMKEERDKLALETVGWVNKGYASGIVTDREPCMNEPRENSIAHV